VKSKIELEKKKQSEVEAMKRLEKEK